MTRPAERDPSSLEPELPWLSDSDVWPSVRALYAGLGPAAWAGRVPFQVTSNPCTARSYTDVILAFVEDWLAAGRPMGEQLPIVEIGAGHGAFAAALQVALARRSDAFARLGVRPHQVVTDLVPENVAAWSNHPGLGPVIRSGEVQVLAHDALDAGGALHDLLQPFRAQGHPVVFVLNYVLDSLPTDAVSFEPEGVHRARGRVATADPADPFGLAGATLEVRWDRFDPEEFDAPERAVVEAVSALGLRGAMPLPIGGRRCLDAIAELAGGHALILSADKGFSDLRSACQPREAAAAITDASMTVNFAALGHWVERRGGVAFNQRTQQDTLVCAAWVQGLGADQLVHTREAFEAHLDRASPGDLFHLARRLIDVRHTLDLQAMLALLKLLDWDPSVFVGLVDALLARLDGAPPHALSELIDAIPRMVENRLVVPNQPDLLFHAATVAQTLGQWGLAAELYQTSLVEAGEQALTLTNLGICLVGLGEREAARTVLVRAAELDPEMLIAEAWLYRLEHDRVPA